MAKYVSLYIEKKPLAKKVKLCDTLFSRTIGLMFHSKLKKEEGILLIAKKKSIAQTSIHSFFVFFTFDALWLDENKIVVDKKRIKPFQVLISPKKPAKYILEIQKKMIIPIGAKIEFKAFE